MRRLPASERWSEWLRERHECTSEGRPPARQPGCCRHADRSTVSCRRPPPPPQSIISLHHKINCVAQNNAEYSVARAKDAFTTYVRTNVLCSVKADCDPGVCVPDTCVCTTIKFSRYVLHPWSVLCKGSQLFFLDRTKNYD